MITEHAKDEQQATGEPKIVAEEHVTWGPGRRMVIPREKSPKDSATSAAPSLKPVVVNIRDFMEGYQVGRDGPPAVVFRAKDDSVIVEVSNLNCDQMAPGGEREFWHRDLVYGELQFAVEGSRTVETETGTVTHHPGEFVYFPRGVAHRNNGHGPVNYQLVIYIRDDLIPGEPPKNGKQPAH
jgi:mannose-6-phosphate isomerase-like protein (cupin superfamily)